MKKYWFWLLSGIFLVVGAVCLYLGFSRSGPVAVPQLSGVRFTPDQSAGYLVEPASVPPLSLGNQLAFTDLSPRKINLPFAFPFAGKLWKEAFINPDGFVSFGNPGGNGLLRSGNLPAVAPYNISLSLSTGGIFTSNGPGQFFITWYKLRPSMSSLDQTNSPPYTFQLILVEDGTLVYRYYEVFSDASGNIVGEAPWIGFLTGQGLSGVAPLDLPVEQSFNSDASGGLLDRFHSRKDTKIAWLVVSGIALALSILTAVIGIRQGSTPEMSPLTGENSA